MFVFFSIQREAIRRGLNILKEELPGGDTFMHEGFKRVHITVSPSFVLHLETLLLVFLWANHVLHFIAGKWADLPWDLWRYVLCSVHVNVCIEEMGLWFFLWPAVNPLTEVLEEGCYATPHSILTAALLLNGWFMVYWDQRGPVWSQIWLLQNADQTIAARAAHLAPGRQEFPHFTGPFCPDALGPLCFVVPHPCLH